MLLLSVIFTLFFQGDRTVVAPFPDGSARSAAGGVGVPQPRALYAGQHGRQGAWLPPPRGRRSLAVLFNWNWHYQSSFLGYWVSIDCTSEEILAF